MRSLKGDTMRKSGALLITAAVSALGLAGCSSDSGLFGNPLTTQSINSAQAAPKANAIDPACYTLSQRIEMLRRDDFTERMEKASVGKSANVSVKRASLAQAAELDKANAEYQAKCSAPALRMPQAAAQGAAIGASSQASAAAAPAANSAQVVSAATPAAPAQPKAQ